MVERWEFELWIDALLGFQVFWWIRVLFDGKGIVDLFLIRSVLRHCFDEFSVDSVDSLFLYFHLHSSLWFLKLLSFHSYSCFYFYFCFCFERFLINWSLAGTWFGKVLGVWRWLSGRSEGSHHRHCKMMPQGELHKQLSSENILVMDENSVSASSHSQRFSGDLVCLASSLLPYFPCQGIVLLHSWRCPRWFS